MTPRERARRLLDTQQNLVLATVSADGFPWISPVFFVPDADYNLYWTSDREARHSANVRATGVGAIVAYEVEPDRPVDGVYLEVKVTEISAPDEVDHGIGVMSQRRQPDRWMIDSAADVTGDGPWRIYRAEPVTIEVRETGERAGKAVARRQGADFR